MKQRGRNRFLPGAQSLAGWFAGILLFGACYGGTGATPRDTGSAADRKAVRTTIFEFSRLADEQQADRLEALLHPEFRVWAQVKGKEGVLALSRSEYLKKIRSKEFGGDRRTVDIQAIQVRGGSGAGDRSITRSEGAL